MPDSIAPAIRGTIYLDNPAGRRLRKQPTPIRAEDVLYSAGGFHAGDLVHVAFRGRDGGQYVVAIAKVACDEETLPTWPRTLDHKAPAHLVADAGDVQLLWPPGENARD